MIKIKSVILWQLQVWWVLELILRKIMSPIPEPVSSCSKQMNPKLNMIGPTHNQTPVVNLKTDSKTMYYSTLYTEIKIIHV